MNEEAQKVFDDILAKDLSALTDSDVLFLKARSQYLSRELKKKYNQFLNEEVEEKEPEPNAERKDWSDHPADQDDGVDE